MPNAAVLKTQAANNPRRNNRRPHLRPIHQPHSDVLLTEQRYVFRTPSATFSDRCLQALPFAINLVTNLIFTPIQFGMRNLPLASVDILIVWGTIIWMMVAIWKHYRWIAVAQMPYFVWVSTATVLQLSITWMNWGS